MLTEIFAVTHSLERAARLRSPGGLPARRHRRPSSASARSGWRTPVKAALMGAGRVIAVDSRRRLELAARLAGQPRRADAAEVRELTGGEGVDVVVNATGFPGSFAQAVEMVRDGGIVIEVGAFVDMGDETFNPAVLCGRNLTMLGIGGEDLLVYEGTLALLARHHRHPASPRWSRTASRRGRARGDGDGARRRRSAKVLITAGMAHRSFDIRGRRALVTGSSRGIGLCAGGRAGGGGLLGRAARARHRTLEQPRGARRDRARTAGRSIRSRSTSPTRRGRRRRRGGGGRDRPARHPGQQRRRAAPRAAARVPRRGVAARDRDEPHQRLPRRPRRRARDGRAGPRQDHQHLLAEVASSGAPTSRPTPPARAA